MGVKPIPVLTLWQPWASLVALGVKRIETRSWSTSHRGPLAIHAAARRSESDLALHWTVLRAERQRGAPCSKPGCGHADGSHVCQFTRTRCFFCNCDGWRYGGPPLGAIVATCALVDVVPIVADPGIGQSMLDLPDRCVAFLPPSTLSVIRDRIGMGASGQIPYGDFTVGGPKQRYAYLLADVEPVNPPVKFKGGQRLTRTWEPT